MVAGCGEDGAAGNTQQSLYMRGPVDPGSSQVQNAPPALLGDTSNAA